MVQAWRNGEIGRRSGLKSRSSATRVWIRVPLPPPPGSGARAPRALDDDIDNDRENQRRYHRMSRPEHMRRSQ